MPTAQEIKAAYPGYIGWNDENAIIADFNATGGAGKEGGGSSSGGTAGFSFDQGAAEKAALEQLRPYYQKLLDIYDGDVALAKKRMEADYERGLRYNTEETANAMGDVAAARAENDRKFKIALGDLDQEMNSRGLTTSGVKATNVQNAKAEDLYTQSQYDAKARDLTLAEKKANEELDVTKQTFLENEGFADTGVANYYNNRQKKQQQLTQEMLEKAGQQAVTKREEAAFAYNAGTTPLTTATPTNYTELLNSALTTSGIPTIK